MKNTKKVLRPTQRILITGFLLVVFAGFFFVSTIAQAFTFTTIDPPGSIFTEAFGINPSGQIVGTFNDSSGVSHGFLRDKNGSFTTFDPPDSILTIAQGINPSGQIVGLFIDSSGVIHGFLATP